ncbi:MAG: DUF4258 domain-containing protein [Terriglobia bacterium]
MKPIRLTTHAVEQLAERGASEAEVQEAVQRGVREPAKRGRFMYRLNFQYDSEWQGRFYAIKQVAPVVVEAQNEVVVVTVYTFYF